MTPSTITQSTMTAREIAALTQKQVSHVNRDIARMMADLTMTVDPSLDLVDYKGFFAKYDAKGFIEVITLDRDLTDCLLTGYSAVARMNVIKRWKELESNQVQIPQTLPEALRMAADLAEHNTKLIEKAKEDAPKVQFVADYVEHGDSKTFTDVAAIMGVKLGFLMSTLKARKIVYKSGGEWMAYAEYAKHFETKVGVNNYTNKETGLPEAKDYKQLRVTTGGLVWMQNRFGKPELQITPNARAV